MIKAFVKSRFMAIIASLCIGAYMCIMRAFSRIDVEGAEPAHKVQAEGKGVICAFWHQRLILTPLIADLSSTQVHMLISMNRDGDIISKGVRLDNVAYIRGSAANPLKRDKNKSGAPALIQLISALKKGDLVAITPDGPRGPAQQAQLGIIKLAAKTGAPIIPIGLSAKHGVHLKSWDATYFANPFSRKKIIFGDPIYVTESQNIEEKRLLLEKALQNLTYLADKKVGKKERSGHNNVMEKANEHYGE